MADQYTQQFAPPQDPASTPSVGQPDVEPPIVGGSDADAASAPLNRADIEAGACEVARRLGANHAEALSCLTGKLADARLWLHVQGPDDARIWLVIVRALVAVPRPTGGWERARRIEVAIDAVNGRPLGFRLVG